MIVLRTDLLAIGRSHIHGSGVFAAQAIPAQTILGEYAGLAEPYTANAFIGRWTMWAENDDGHIELRNGRRRGNDLRYVNHSSTPNIEVDGFVFSTIRDIAAGEEMTWNYGEDWM